MKEAGHRLRQHAVLAAAAARENDLEPFLRLGVELGDLLRRVLEVAVHDHDPLAARVVETGVDRVLLAEISTETDPADTRQPLAVLPDLLPGSIRAAVIDQHDLVAAGQL